MNIYQLNFNNMKSENFLTIRGGTTLPKFHLLCGKDDLRPAMTGVLLTSTNVVATDAYRMGWALTSELFGVPEGCEIPENFIIPAKAWAELAKKGAIGLEVAEKTVMVYDRDMNFKTFSIVDAKYPGWENVIPKGETSIEKIGLAPKILKVLCDFYPEAMMKFTFTGEDRAVLIHWQTEEINLNGVIMPVMLNV